MPSLLAELAIEAAKAAGKLARRFVGESLAARRRREETQEETALRHAAEDAEWKANTTTGDRK